MRRCFANRARVVTGAEGEYYNPLGGRTTQASNSGTWTATDSSIPTNLRLHVLPGRCRFRCEFSSKPISVLS